MIASPNSKVPSHLQPQNARYALVEDLVESIVIRFVKKYGMSDEDHQLARAAAHLVYMQAERLYKPELKVPFAAYIAMRVKSRMIDWRISLLKDRHREITETRLTPEGTESCVFDGETSMGFMEVLRDSVSTDALAVARVAVDPDNECMEAAGGKWTAPEHDHNHRMEVRTYFMLMGWSVARVGAAFAELHDFLGDHIDTSGRTSRKTSHKTY